MDTGIEKITQTFKMHLHMTGWSQKQDLQNMTHFDWLYEEYKCDKNSDLQSW